MPATPKVAMVLAAGLGTRMAPVNGGTLPKPLVQLGGKALIDHVLDRHVEAGIERAVVNVHHKADLIEAHLADRRAPRIEISDERDVLLDTGGGVKRALSRLGSGPFLIHNSDSVWIEGVGSNIARLYDAWSDARMDCLMLLALTSQSLGYSGRGDFAFTADGRIRRRVEQEIVPFAFAGVSLAHPRLLEGSQDGKFSLNLVWDRAIARGRAFGVRMEGTWMHVGTPEALAQAEQRLTPAGR
ncbi:MAG TPA: nucleotidyltransferase family protein [Hyphomicrobiaceae bacterium]|nr:nucleotidyltransferase family protein [Hyphomicrobiaceae bacterium]